MIPLVKEICADFLDFSLDEYEVIFCSNTTEAINIAAQNWKKECTDECEAIVLNTLLEHHSNELPWRYISNTPVIRLSVDNNGFINAREMEQILQDYNLNHIHGKKRIKLVALCGASNVLGTYNNIKTLAGMAHNYNARVLVDGAQLVAHRSLSMESDDIDYLAFSGHKMYAPFGSGVLVVRKSLLNFKEEELTRIQSSGEENLTGIAALGKAIILLQRIGMTVISREESELTSYILKGLSTVAGIKIYGVNDCSCSQFQEKGSTVVFSCASVPHNMAAKELAERGGIGVRSGCFCAHMIVKQLMNIHPARIYTADKLIKIFPDLIVQVLPGLIRVSLGLLNEKKHIDHFIMTLQDISDSKHTLLDKILARTLNATPFLPDNSVHKEMELFCKKIIGKVYA